MTDFLTESDHGNTGTPGTSYRKCWAGVKVAKNGQYELHVSHVWGSNRSFTGTLEEHGRVERRFRAVELEYLLKLGLEGIREDAEFSGSKPGVGPFLAAIRDAVYDAQDSISDSEAEQEATEA